MAHLRLSLLGSFQATLDGRPITGFKSNKARGLLAYLVVEGDRAHRREALAGLLWPNWPDRDAFNNLRYTLSNVRHAIRDVQAKSPIILVSRDSLRLNPSSDCWVDVGVFGTLVGATQAPDVQQLEEALALYQGSFLEGFSVAESPGFEDWMVATRERLAREVSSALHFLAGHYEQRGDYPRAESYTWRQLSLQPWDEAAHRQAMRILALTGRRSAALAQYQACCRVLAEELGIEPDDETTRLFEQIRDGQLRALQPSLGAPPAVAAELPVFLRDEAPRAERAIFVAREKELKQLDLLLTSAMRGQGQVAFVTGEMGSGKTALLQAFARRAEADRANLLAVSGNCNAYTGIGDPYLPFREILGLLTGDIEAKGAAGAITRETARRLWDMIPVVVQILVENGPDLIDTFLSRITLLARGRAYAPGGANWLTGLEELLQRKPSSSFGRPGPPQSDLFEQYTKVLQAVAQEQPLLAVVDDLQWGDPGSISLLFHLGRRLAGSRILLVGTYRPEEVALERDGERHPLEAVVNEFGRTSGDIRVNVDLAEGQEFIDALLCTEPNRLGPSFRQMLYQHTRGQPLFTIELLRGLQERGDLIHDAEGCWTEGPLLDWDRLPARVEAAIRERIGRLPETLRRALAVASVEGEEFTAEVVARIRGLGEQQVMEDLSAELDRKHRIIRAQSIERVESHTVSRYRFRHILFQKYLYGGLDEVERVHLHEQVGAALEALYAGHADITSIAGQLAWHFEEAGITEKAIYYLHQAGDRSVRLSAHQEAIAQLTKALELLMSLPDSRERTRQELALQVSLSKAWMGDIPRPNWVNALVRARELCQQLGETSQLCLILGEWSIFHYVRAEYQMAQQLAEEMLTLAQQSGDPLLPVIAHWHLGFVLFGLGEYVAARDHLRQVIAFYKPEEHHHTFVQLRGSDPGVSALAYDACCLWCLGYPEQALTRSQEALALGRRLSHAFTLADVLDYGGCLFDKMRRALGALRDNGEELARLSMGMGFSSFGGTGLCHEGDALAQLGLLQEGLAELRKGLDLRQSMNVFVDDSVLLSGLAEAQALAGMLDEALSTLGRALAFVEQTGERMWEPELHRLRARIHVARGEEAQAETSLNIAIQIARRQEAKSLELRASLDLGRLWQSRGRKTQAREMLEKIYDWFTEGFDTPDLVEAGGLIQELSR